jgi:malate dehydrogenase
MRRAKISIIGAGNVGATAAHWAASKELGDIVLVDIPARSRACRQGRRWTFINPRRRRVRQPHCRRDRIRPTDGSDVVIITAGIPRKPGMSRDDLINTNTADRQKSPRMSPGIRPMRC